MKQESVWVVEAKLKAARPCVERRVGRSVGAAPSPDSAWGVRFFASNTINDGCSTLSQGIKKIYQLWYSVRKIISQLCEFLPGGTSRSYKVFLTVASHLQAQCRCQPTPAGARDSPHAAETRCRSTSAIILLIATCHITSVLQNGPGGSLLTGSRRCGRPC
jgi:hypothetical protein